MGQSTEEPTNRETNNCRIIGRTDLAETGRNRAEGGEEGTVVLTGQPSRRGSSPRPAAASGCGRRSRGGASCGERLAALGEDEMKINERNLTGKK
jgi:hypothetical protein